jgi:ubiquinone/menaquinone biosynthesis C-methylase UbiE
MHESDLSELIPPEGLHRVGRGDYIEMGRRWLQHFRTLGGLRSDESVLDIGCGTGRIAVALTGFLEEHTAYEGIDVSAAAVEWCRERITSRHPNFRFRVADIRNKAYNPRGALDAATYRLPFDDACFDFVVLTSVFTHLLPAETENYLREIARVLTPVGRCVATFFLLNPAARAALATGDAWVRPCHHLGVYSTTSLDVPEHSIFYEEDFVLAAIARSGLDVARPIAYGNWCGRHAPGVGQDIVVMRRAR